MRNNLKCPVCQGKMAFLMEEKFQKGDMGPWVGNINLTMQGGFEMEVYACCKCGKLEFFLPEGSAEWPEDPEEEILETPESDMDIVGVSMDGVPQVRCPACGRNHDFDYPRCPRCNHLY